MKKTLGGVAAACLFLLTACGGGGENPQASSTQNERATPAGVPVQTSTDEILYVSLAGGATRGSNIVVKDASSTVLTQFTTIDSFPQALANYGWVTAKRQKHLRIKFKAGEYEMQSGWVWNEATSGHDGYFIILEPEGAAGSGSAENVVFLGSRKLSNGALQAGGNVEYTLQASDGIKPFDQLWSRADGRLVRARQPNEGSFYYVNDPDNSTGQVKFSVYENDLAAVNSAAAAGSAQLGSELVLLGAFFATRHPFSSATVDAPAYSVSFTKGERHVGVNEQPVQRTERYFLENYAQALDASREWFMADSNAGDNVFAGTLKYRPVSASYDLEAPQLSTLLNMSGTLNDDTKRVKNVMFDRLKFRYTLGTTPNNEGSSFAQGEFHVPAAIDIAAASTIKFYNCEVSHVGGNGVRFGRQVMFSVFENGTVYDVGAGGVLVGGKPHEGGPQSPTNNLDRLDFTAGRSTRFNTVNENLIYDVGARYPTGNGVWVGHSVWTTVDDNVVLNTVHSGISIGYWNNDPAQPSMHLRSMVTNNYLYNIGSSGLSDLGGIYTLGESDATYDSEISGNLIRKVNVYSGVGRGIYLDENSSHYYVGYNALVDGQGLDAAKNTLLYGVGQHFGALNEIERNVFVAASPISIMRRVPSGTTLSPEVPLDFHDNHFFPTSRRIVSPTHPGLTDLIANGAWVAPSGTQVPTRSNNRTSFDFTPAWVTSGILTADSGKLATLCGCIADTTIHLSDTGWPNVPTYQNGPDPLQMYNSSKLSGLLARLPTGWTPATWSPTAVWKGAFSDAPTRIQLATTSSVPTDAQLDSTDTDDAYWGLASANKAVAFGVERESDKVTEYLKLVDGSVDAATSYFPIVARYGFKNKAGEKVTISFRVKFDTNANVQHGWRKTVPVDTNSDGIPDSEILYTGPQVDFVYDAATQKVQVKVGGTKKADLLAGTWAEVKISMLLVQGAAGTWDLTVTPQGGSPTTYAGLATVSGVNFDALTDAYFGSNYQTSGSTPSVTKFNYIRYRAN